MVRQLLLSRPLSLPRRGGSCCSLRCLSSSCSCLCCSSFCSFSRSSCCCLMARSSCCNLHRTKRHEKVQFALFSRLVLAKTTFLNKWVSVLAFVFTLLFISLSTFPSLLKQDSALLAVTKMNFNVKWQPAALVSLLSLLVKTPGNCAEFSASALPNSGCSAPLHLSASSSGSLAQ